MALVASLYNLPPRVLPSIQAVEGGQVGTVHHNTDGTDDLGLMQVNSRWIPAFAQFTGLPAEAVRERLVARPCFNIAAGGAILRTYLDEAKGDLMRAVGFYHSHTSARAERYRLLVVGSASRLFADASR